MLKTNRNSNQQNRPERKTPGRTKPSGKSKPSSPNELSLKERMAQKRQAAQVRKEVTNFAVFAAFFAILIGVPLGLVGGPKTAVGAVLAVLCFAFSLKFPRQALWGLLIYLPFGGTITYSIGNSPLLQLAKDGFYLPALIGVIQYCKRERLPIFIPKQLMPAMWVLIGFCVMTLLVVNGYQQIFGKPGEKPLAMGILGLKVLLGYAPLIGCAYHLLRNKKDFLFLMRLTLVLVMICCGLAFVQYMLLKTGRCAGTQGVGGALFKASLDARCFVGGSLLYSPEEGQIRLPGTFVAPWQWGWFLISSSFLVFPSAFNDPKFYWRIAGLLGLGEIFIMAVISGQRIALALVPVVIAVLLFFTGQVTNLKRFIPVAIVLGVGLSAAAVQNAAVVEERMNSFISRWNASPPYAFIQDQLTWALKDNYFLGHGLGRATNAARALGETELVETYYPKVIFEIGPFGALAFLAVVSTLTYLTFKAYRSLRDRNLRSYGASLWLFVLFISYNTYYYPLDVDPVAIYYWFYAGVVLKLPEIYRLAQLELEEAEPQGKDKNKNKKQQRLKRPGFA